MVERTEVCGKKHNSFIGAFLFCCSHYTETEYQWIGCTEVCIPVQLSVLVKSCSRSKIMHCHNYDRISSDDF